MESSYPKCDFLDAPLLAIVSYPRLREMRPSGDITAVRQGEEIDRFQQNFEAQKLRSKDQLPDLDVPQGRTTRLSSRQDCDRQLFRTSRTTEP